MRKLTESTVIDALRETRGNQVKAAEILGVSQQSVYAYVKRHPRIAEQAPFSKISHLIDLKGKPRNTDLEAVSKEAILKALRDFDGNLSKAADYLRCTTSLIKNAAVTYPEIKRELEEIDQRRLDDTIDAMMYQIREKKDVRMIKFFLTYFKRPDEKEDRSIAERMAKAELRAEKMKKAEAIDIESI